MKNILARYIDKKNIMNSNIKEIFERIEDTTKDYVGIDGCVYQDLDRNELNLIIYYIINLQKENEILNSIIDEIEKC